VESDSLYTAGLGEITAGKQVASEEETKTGSGKFFVRGSKNKIGAGGSGQIWVLKPDQYSAPAGRPHLFGVDRAHQKELVVKETFEVILDGEDNVGSVKEALKQHLAHLKLGAWQRTHPESAAVPDAFLIQGSGSGSAFIGMERFRTDLMKLIAPGESRLPPAVQMSFARAMVSGLQGLHEQQSDGGRIVHLDIKPHNFMTNYEAETGGKEDNKSKEGKEGNVTEGKAEAASTQLVIIDFGMARLQQLGELQARVSLGGLGTPAYMAPKVLAVAKGQALPVGADYTHCDVWAVCATIGTMVWGLEPWSESNPHAVTTLAAQYAAKERSTFWPFGAAPSPNNVRVPGGVAGQPSLANVVHHCLNPEGPLSAGELMALLSQ
jgi:serine/threonine protein kinase